MAGRLAGDGVMTGRQGWNRILDDLHAGREIPSSLPKRNGFVYGDQDPLLDQPYYGYAGNDSTPSTSNSGSPGSSSNGTPSYAPGRPDVYFEGELLDPHQSFNDQMAARSPRIAEIWNSLKASHQSNGPKQPMSADAKELLDKMGVNY